MAKSPAQRKRESRERKAQYLLSVGAELMSLEIYKGTRADLEYLKQTGGFERDAEIITLLIHNAAEIIKRDMSRNDELLGIPNEISKTR